MRIGKIYCCAPSSKRVLVLMALAIFLSISAQPSDSMSSNGDPSIPVILGNPLEDSDNAFHFASKLDYALHYIESYKDAFSMSAFKESFQQHCLLHPHSYDWLLPSYIPKTIGQSLESSHYGALKYETMLTRSSEVMQRYRVAWEQVADLDDNLSFQHEFNKTKNDLNRAIISLSVALADKRISPVPNPTGRIMPDKLKYLSGSAQSTRNFYILKDYINTLEYYSAVFFHFYDRN